MGSVEERLAELGVELPEVGEPMAQYLPAKKVGRTIYVSGQGPYLDGVPNVIGRVDDRIGRPGELLLSTMTGGLRLLEPLTSELLPRIC